MPFYLTRDPVPSADMRNVFDNAQNLDLALNDLTSSLWTDRLGRSRMSWFGLESAFSVKLSDFESRFTSQIVEQEATFDASQADKENRFQHFLVSSGYVFLGDYEDGPFQFSARNQYIRYDNQYYRLNAATDVGFTTTGTDATSFANDVAHLVLMDGDVLRQELASPSGASNVGLSQGGTVQDAVYWLTPEMFGAKASDPSFDNQYKIQEAIDAANSEYLSTGSIQTVYIPNGVFWVGNRTITNTGESTQNGLLSIQMKSGVRLCGEGTIKAKANAYGSGAYYRMIGSDRGDRVQDVEIIGITLDGNVSNQVASKQCSNIVLEASRNILINGVKSVNSNGNGIMVRGRYPDAVYNVRIVNCYVYNCNFIGIQSSQFNGLVISDNTVDTTGDNGIDIYGDTGISRTDSNGVNFSITGNTVRNSRMAGIFPETVAHGTVSCNSIYNCAKGIHINRIYSTPKSIVVTGNNISKTTGSGIRIYGDMEGVTICGNNFSDWTGNAIQLGASNANASGVYIHGNTFIPSDATSYILQVMGPLASRIEVRNNTVRNTIGLTMDLVYNNIAATSTGVYVDSWAFASGPIGSTGLQMYRSGTFTPTIEGFTTAGAAEYTSQQGQYLRIGNVVHYSLYVAYTGATGVGPLTITGLPFLPNGSVLQPETAAHTSMVTTSASESFWVLANGRGLNPRIKTMGSSGEPTYLRMDGVNYVAGTIRAAGFYFV